MIRIADVGDARAIAALHVQAWQVAYRGLLPDDVLDALSVDERAELWSHLLSEGVRVLVAEQQAVTGLAGFVSCGPSRDVPAPARHGELYALYAGPSVWGSGVGRALHDAAVAELSAQAFVEASLWVLDGNQRARAFYARQGWHHDDAVRVEDMLGARLRELRYTRPLAATPGSSS